MSGWPFVIAAYSATVILVGGLLIAMWRSMRSAEQDAEALRSDK